MSVSDFDTLLAAYTGAAVNALTPVASNDNCTTGDWSGGSPSSCITFPFTLGKVYSVQVDGVGGRKGNFNISAMFQCVLSSQTMRAADAVSVRGDAISSPIPVPLTGLGSKTLTATTVGATLEVGEPALFASVGESASIWFSWTAPRRGVLRVSTKGSPFNTVLGVYSTGAAVTTAGTSASIATFGSLTLLASNDDCAAGAKARTSGSCVTVSVASPGDRYLVKVDGAAGAQGVVDSLPSRSGFRTIPL